MSRHETNSSGDTYASRRTKAAPTSYSLTKPVSLYETPANMRRTFSSWLVNLKFQSQLNSKLEFSHGKSFRINILRPYNYRRKIIHSPHAFLTYTCQLVHDCTALPILILKNIHISPKYSKLAVECE